MASAHPCAAPERRFIEIKTDYESHRKALKDLSREPSRSGGDDTVPAAAALSFRAAANALRYAMTQRSGRSCSSPERNRPGERAAEAPAEPEVDDDPTDEELFSAMQGQWVEVECLLRVQLRGEAALEEARERVNASLAFDRGLSKRAVDSKILKGTIFQALLAKADGAASATAASVGLSSMSDDEWEAEAKGADALRKLVRIKVQDDNDLKAANGALTSCAEFFSNLRVYGSRNGLTAEAVIAKLEESY